MTDTILRFDADDPRFTAYALGEIEDDAERAALAALCESDPEAAAFVAEIRETADLLTAELAGAPAPALTDIQRAAIKQAGAQTDPAAQEASPSVSPSRRGLWIGAGTALAAAAGVALFLTNGSAKQDAKEKEAQLQERLESGVSLEEGVLAHAKDSTSATSTPQAPPPSGTAMALDEGKMGAERQLQEVSRNGILGILKESPGGAFQKLGKNADFSSGLIGGSGTGAGYGGQPPSQDPSGHFRLRSGDDSDNEDGDGRFQTDLPDREAYSHTRDNPFVEVAKDPRSTFSIDVDTGSYSNIRRMLQGRRLPPADSVRIEEMINYFEYDYPQPATEHPFSLSAEVGKAPWNPEHLLVKIGVQGKKLTDRVRPRANLVFLIDVSGSMGAANKLPLLKRGIRMLVDSLDPEDRVAIVVYAGAAGQVLPSTPVRDRRKILRALERLNAGGSTNGGAGIELAYKIARRHFVQGGINRVMLATDGDFNVGVSHTGGLVRLVEKKAKSGVFLTVLGFGMGNYNDAMLEEISNKGNGHYAYIDTVNEARKVLVHQLDSTLVTIAKDVKIQVELNPRKVASYRLIGYANRILAHRDFDDDTKDAGEIGAGHSVTALYEIVPAGPAAAGAGGLKYQSSRVLTAAAEANELLNLKLRYKKPDGDTSRLVEVGIPAGISERPSVDFNLAAGVAAFGMVLRRSEHRGDASYRQVLKLLERGVGSDRFGYRRELIGLVRTARSIDRRR